MADEEDRSEIGRRVKDARNYLGLSQEDVASALGIPRSSVSQIEAGTRGIDAIELKKLARILGRSVEYLAGEDESPDRQERIDVLARAVDGLSDADVGELKRFAAYLKSRSENTDT